jgi:hypothetical protein
VFRAQTTPEGEPLVADVRHLSPHESLPDIVVRWTDAADRADRATPSGPVPIRRTDAAWKVGHHTPDAFCLCPPALAPSDGVLDSVDLHRLIVDAARVPAR